MSICIFEDNMAYHTVPSESVGKVKALEFLSSQSRKERRGHRVFVRNLFFIKRNISYYSYISNKLCNFSNNGSALSAFFASLREIFGFPTVSGDLARKI